VIKPNLLLSLYGIANCIIILLVMANLKHVSWKALPFCWLFMSIMFPFIFAMSLRNLGEKTKLVASFQIMSIVGGAVAPPIHGMAGRCLPQHGDLLCFALDRFHCPYYLRLLPIRGCSRSPARLNPARWLPKPFTKAKPNGMNEPSVCEGTA